IFGNPVGLIGLKGFERDDVVAEKFEAQLIEIVLADLHREVRAPIVLHPLEANRTAGDKILDAVGTRTERRLERGGGNVALAAFAIGTFPVMLRQDQEFADNMR